MPNKSLMSVKEILQHMKNEETKSLIEEVNHSAPIRLPNADWDENDIRDMIDFPCSNAFLDHFHMRGLTPRHSAGYRGQRPDYKSYQLRKGQGSQQTGGVEL